MIIGGQGFDQERTSKIEKMKEVIRLLELALDECQKHLKALQRAANDVDP